MTAPALVRRLAGQGRGPGPIWTSGGISKSNPPPGPGRPSVGIGADDLAPVAAPEPLPGRDVDRVLDELDVSVAEQRVDAPGVVAPGRDVQRQVVPVRVRLVAVRQPTPAVVLLVVRRPAAFGPFGRGRARRWRRPSTAASRTCSVSPARRPNRRSGRGHPITRLAGTGMRSWESACAFIPSRRHPGSDPSRRDFSGGRLPGARAPAAPSDTLVMACCDPAVGLLAAELARSTGVRLIALPRSSRAALVLLGQGLVHVAGVHLARVGDPGGNATVVRDQHGAGYRLLHVARWEEGVTFKPCLHLPTIREAVNANLRWIGREPGSGARQCRDELFGSRQPPLGLASDHRSVAEAVRSGWADAGVCPRLVSEEAGLDFLGVREEPYDLCFPDRWKSDHRIRALIDVVRSSSYRRALGELPGYESSETGELQRGALMNRTSKGSSMRTSRLGVTFHSPVAERGRRGQDPRPPRSPQSAVDIRRQPLTRDLVVSVQGAPLASLQSGYYTHSRYFVRSVRISNLRFPISNQQTGRTKSLEPELHSKPRGSAIGVATKAWIRYRLVTSRAGRRRPGRVRGADTSPDGSRIEPCVASPSWMPSAGSLLWRLCSSISGS